MVVVVMVVAVLMLVVALVVVVVVMVVIALFALHGLNPSGGGGHLVEVERVGVDDLAELHVAIVALVDGRLRLYLADDGLQVCHLVGRNHVGLVEQDDVAKLNLLDNQAGEVFLVVISLEVVAQSKLVAHAQGVDHGHDGVEARHAILQGARRHHLRIGGDGLRDGGGLADAAGLDDDVVELAEVDEVVELLHEVHLQRAADAPVRQGHQAVVGLAYHASLLDEVGVDVHLAYVVHDDGEANAFLVIQDAVEQCGLSAA